MKSGLRGLQQRHIIHQQGDGEMLSVFQAGQRTGNVVSPSSILMNRLLCFASVLHSIHGMALSCLISCNSAQSTNFDTQHRMALTNVGVFKAHRHQYHQDRS